MSEDKYARVTLAFLRRKQRLGTMLKILTKLMSSTSKVIHVAWRRTVKRKTPGTCLSICLMLSLFSRYPRGRLLKCNMAIEG